jgi:hypothetical protein
LQSVEVTHSDEGRSGFQIVFQVGRGSTDLLDYPAVTSLQFRPLARVILLVTFTGMPQVLMDGIITHQQLNPGNQPGSSTFTLTGEDVSVMMDREEKNAEHPAQSEMVIALKLIGSYAQYGLIPMVIPPPALDIPLPIERTPVQQATDLNYLKELRSVSIMCSMSPQGPYRERTLLTGGHRFVRGSHSGPCPTIWDRIRMWTR